MQRSTFFIYTALMIDPTGSSLGNSLDIQQDLRNQLKAILPQAFSDNNLDFEKLKQLLGDDFTSPREERYGISWAGKTEAFRELQQTTTSTLSPDSASLINHDSPSVGSESDCPSSRTHEGIFIEGENLEVLKVLQKSYYGKVKMIYIDPPYNTGNDSFVYPDDFSETKAEYQEKGNINLNRLNLWQKNSKDSGKYHSSWLSMMYPRLFMARNLLREDGVIFISIDDNEQANLKLLMDEIFGEENFVANMIWQSKSGGSHDEKCIVKECEYILVYSKNKNIIEFGRQKIVNPNYKLEDKHLSVRGRYLLNKLDRSMRGEHYSDALNYSITAPDGSEIWAGGLKTKKTDWNWRWSKTKVEWGFINDFLEVKKDANDNWAVYSKQYEYSDNNGDVIERTYPYRSTILSSQFNTTQGGAEVLKLLDGNVFDYSKPSKLLIHILKVSGVRHNDIILDFFAGSGTTAQAVMELNAEDGGNRQFICVQMPEPTDPNSEAYKAGYQTIADITRARIQKVQEKLSLKNKVQYYQLQPSNFKIWQNNIDTEEELLAQLELYSQPHTTPETPEVNLLTELMLKAGFMLTSNVQTISTADGIKLYDIENGTMTVALSALSEKVILTVCERKPKEFICLDNLFESDVQKSNWSLQLAEAGVNLQVI